ncbi:ion transporter [Anaerovorax odorimutans]|uniref:Ion transporter n=1 Tax=Anaerovorax odorimutans TaxID=109327 RepID=A0ABT1RQG1_9FIRM|nr:ion transporter [Anaerovorax odorimutans]
MRKYIYRLIAKPQPGDRISQWYDWFIMCVAIISIVPMVFRDPSEQVQEVLKIVEVVSVYLLFVDYVLRWITFDFKSNMKSPWAFILYPITPFAIMDMLGILPSVGLIPASFQALRLLRLAKILQYSKSFERIVNVFSKQRKLLVSVLVLAVAYIFISALIMFSYEPAESFPSFFDALYWATTALTTVGYGDIYPLTEVGKIISMISSLFGVAVIAMPASIVTAGFMDELNKDLEEKERLKEKLREAESQLSKERGDGDHE